MGILPHISTWFKDKKKFTHFTLIFTWLTTKKITPHFSHAFFTRQKNTVFFTLFFHVFKRTEFHMLNIFHMQFTCISHLFHTFALGSVVTCMDFRRGLAQDIVKNDWIQSLKERGIQQTCAVLLLVLLRVGTCFRLLLHCMLLKAFFSFAQLHFAP